MRLPRVIAGVLCLFLCSPAAVAQTFQGQLRGTVAAGGRPLDAAAAVLIEDATGLRRAATTNDDGEFLFAAVTPGTYTLRVTLSGFRTFERPALQIATQSSLRVDVTLEPGDIVEVIRVDEPMPGLGRGDGSFTALLDRAALDTRPSAGRNIFIMAGALPTVLPTGNPQFVRQQDQSNSSLISLGGGPRRNNAYVLDGVPIVDIVNRAAFIPSMHAVEELRVQLSAYDAEIGRTSGGVFNAVVRSGSNAWRGSAMYQNRPDWAAGRLYFTEKNNLDAPDSYYHLFGGAFGGPIVPNRTFFFATSEGYQSRSPRSTVLRLPTDAERRGDFSQSGVTIYDPLTTRRDPADPSRFIRDPFPGNRIPLNRLNPVALALLQYLPLPTSGNARPAVADVVDAAQQITAKVTHRWTDALTTNALVAWYGSSEPDARFYGGDLFDNGADPGDGSLIRRVRLVAVNNLWTPGSRTAVTLRVGSNNFLDDNRPAPFDPSGLGFSPAYLALVPLEKFPGIGVADYGRGGSLLGDRSQERGSYYAYVANATATTLLGRQTVKMGGEYRVNGVSFRNIGGMGGFNFSRDFTLGPDPNAPASATGDAFAAFLLGYPSSGGISTSSPIDAYLNYWSAFVQDDIRVNPRLTFNLGLRYEYETGLRERDDHLAVGWAHDAPFPVQVTGTRPDGTPLVLTGGLLYAGLDGAPRHQGDPNPLQFSPRLGFAYALGDRAVVRGGYGLFWAPHQGIVASEGGTGTRGYNQSTNYVATGGNPLMPCDGCSLTNPFPAGITQPTGSALGRMTGVGGYVEFVDPASRQGHMHRYSLELQREMRALQVIVSAAYLGARGEDLAIGGSSGSWRSVNQLDPKYLALGTALQEPVANPFFGTPLGVGILAEPTVPRAQLLRPYPHFDGVYATRSSLARSRYHAMVLTADRRLANGWAAAANYTWSRLEDNQFGESNFFAGGSGTKNYYDLDAEYGVAVLDTPHRLTLSGTATLPLGILVSAVGTYQSGFPVTVLQTPNNANLLGNSQRPDVVGGIDAGLSDRYDATCSCIRWLNPAAWTQAAAFTLGNAPRTDIRQRTPSRHQWDIAIQKAQRIAAATVTLRGEIINVFNRPDFTGPSIAFGDATFGQIRGDGGFPRLLQVSAQVAW